MGDIPSTIAVLVVTFVLAAVAIRPFSDSERGLLWTSFAAHVVSAIAMVVIVGGVYGSGDMFGYHIAGRFFADRLRDDFFDMAPRLLEIFFQQAAPLPFPGIAGGSNTGSMQALSGFICLIVGDSIYGVCLAIAALNFGAKLALYRVMKVELPAVTSSHLIVACLLLPSAVFWSSGLLKEPIAMLGLTSMVYGAHRMVRYSRYVSGLLWFGLGVMFVGLLKGYLIAPFGIGAGFFFASRAIFATGRTIQTRYLLLAAMIAVGSVMATGAALPHFSAETFEEEARVAQAVGQRTQGGSNFALAGGSLVAQVPLALITVLYRPFIFEATNPLIAVSALETLAATILSLSILSGTARKSLRSIFETPALAFCVGFVLTLAVGVGLTTTNLGTLSRYRMPLTPFYAVILVTVAPALLRMRRAPVPAPAPRLAPR